MSDHEQLSLLNDAGRPAALVSNATLARNLQAHLLGPNPDGALAAHFQMVLPIALEAAERVHGLPITVHSLRPYLDAPLSAIPHLVASSSATGGNYALLQESLAAKLAAPEAQAFAQAAAATLLQHAPELLVAPENTPSPLFAAFRASAQSFVAAVCAAQPAEVREILVEAFVLAQANQQRLEAGTITKLFWPQSGDDTLALFIAGCVDGQARAIFRRVLHKSDDAKRQFFASLPIAELFAELEYTEP